MIRMLINAIRGEAVDFIASMFPAHKWDHRGWATDTEAALAADNDDLRAQIRELEIAGTRVCDELTDNEGKTPSWLLKREADSLKSLRDLLRERAFRAAPRETAYPYF